MFIVIAVFIANDTIIAHTACPPPWGAGDRRRRWWGGLAMTMMFTIAITALYCEFCFSRLQTIFSRITLAGAPAHMQLAGMALFTKDAAPAMLPSPILHPGSKVVPMLAGDDGGGAADFGTGIFGKNMPPNKVAAYFLFLYLIVGHGRCDDFYRRPFLDIIAPFWRLLRHKDTKPRRLAGGGRLLFLTTPA